MNKADGNFLNPFYYRLIGETKIFIGSYPLHEIDVGRLYEAKVTAVLSLLNKSDIR
jgi:hypothetical protein